MIRPLPHPPDPIEAECTDCDTSQKRWAMSCMNLMGDILSRRALWRELPEALFNVKRQRVDPEKLKLLKELSAQTRIARAVLVREAIDDLLVKYKLLKPKRKP